jgi:hypothetical protein
MSTKRFKQLARFQFSDGRFIVISETLDERISVGQQIRLPDEPDKFVFVKNAFIFSSKQMFMDFIKVLNTITLSNESEEKNGKRKTKKMDVK